MAKKNKATEVAEVKEEVTEAVETEEVKAEEQKELDGFLNIPDDLPDEELPFN
jgi:hypothetical protein